MNKIFTLIIAVLCLTATSKAQVVLNEIYTDPGSGRHEFFELYNTSGSSTPVSMDGYTIISYFEEGSNRGFYILDLPNLSIGPRSFFTGASSNPFNYQGTTASNAAQFSWNDPLLLSNFGYLRKWVDNGLNLADGNKNYDLATISPGFNDFFPKRSGSGASYNAFVYKNGVLINTFFGGAGGSNAMPIFITSMPNIRIEQLSATGIITFNINFNSYKNKPAEFVGQDAGTDNGFIRTLDGTCGSWTKSSSDAKHTPGSSNGKPVESGGSVTVSAFLTRDVTSMDTKIIYDVTSAPLNVFPVVMEIYVDNGTVPGELDAADTYVESKTENKVDDGPFISAITPYTQNALVVVKQAAGCLDKVLFREAIAPISLALTLIDWQGRRVDGKVLLSWTLAENELLDYIELERSYDGVSYKAAGLVFGTDKKGTETYAFKEKVDNGDRLTYRLNINEKSGKIIYSRILTLTEKKSGLEIQNTIRLIENPVTSGLKFEYTANSNAPELINIYSASGLKVYSNVLAVSKEVKIIFNLDLNILPGLYIMEIISNTNNSTAKFIKR